MLSNIGQLRYPMYEQGNSGYFLGKTNLGYKQRISEHLGYLNNSAGNLWNPYKRTGGTDRPTVYPGALHRKIGNLEDATKELESLMYSKSDIKTGSLGYTVSKTGNLGHTNRKTQSMWFTNKGIGHLVHINRATGNLGLTNNKIGSLGHTNKETLSLGYTNGGIRSTRETGSLGLTDSDIGSLMHINRETGSHVFSNSEIERRGNMNSETGSLRFTYRETGSLGYTNSVTGSLGYTCTNSETWSLGHTNRETGSLGFTNGGKEGPWHSTCETGSLGHIHSIKGNFGSINSESECLRYSNRKTASLGNTNSETGSFPFSYSTLGNSKHSVNKTGIDQYLQLECEVGKFRNFNNEPGNYPCSKPTNLQDSHNGTENLEHSKVQNGSLMKDSNSKTGVVDLYSETGCENSDSETNSMSYSHFLSWKLRD
jgi:hypothetical protein